ncbi:MAG TPA: cytochrome c3 family protein [Phycisphaerae bacterium]
MSDSPQPAFTERRRVPPARTAYFELEGRFRRRMLRWSVVAALLALAWAAGRYLLAGPTLFQNGALITAHQRVATDCAACHGSGEWALSSSVTPDRCLACHADEPHPTRASTTVPSNDEYTKLRAGLPPVEPCQACHREHQGAAADITRIADARCQRCHQIVGPQLDHPEFILIADRALAAAARAATGLKFSHDLHLRSSSDQRLQPLRAQGCDYCHHLSASGRDFEPVTFDAHCAACHLKTQAHKTLGAVGWAQLRAAAGADARKLTLPAAAWKDAAKELENKKEDIEDNHDLSKEQQDAAIAGIDAVLDARKLVQPCLDCHRLSVLSDEGGLRVDPTRYRQRWFTSARFDHRPHLRIKCTDCHALSEDRAVERASVLLPALSQCSTCHQPAGTAPARCTTCHDYHRRRAGYAHPI